MKLTFLLPLITVCAVQAQIPQLVAIPVAIESPDMRDGLYDVTVRWYTQSVGGSQLAIEPVAIYIRNGSSTITLGNAGPLPFPLLERGNAWISVQFKGAEEPADRYQVTPQAFAHTSGFALVAASLDPRATGLVTSINEIAGALELRGSNGIQIEREGQSITITTKNMESAGEFQGDGMTTEFTLQLPDSIGRQPHLFCSVESQEELIQASAWFDSTNRSYRIRTSAVLVSGEKIRWQLFHR